MNRFRSHLHQLLGIAAVLWPANLATAYQVLDYASADALVAGTGLAAGFPVSAPYTLASVQDNDWPNQFGMGTQIIGLPGAPTDSDDFVFVGSGSLTVDTSGTYNFFTSTDDGSRVQISINGGPAQQIITDDILWSIHTAASDPVLLTAGDRVDFDWMWFERAGEAAGDFFYNRAGVDTLIGDPAQGLSLDGGIFTGKLYKAEPTTTPVLWDPADGGNGHVYMYIDSFVTWQEARDAAAALTPPSGFRTGHLVTVSEAEENEFLYGQFSTYGTSWLGFTDELIEGEWRWIDDTPGIWQDPDNFPNPMQTAYASWDPSSQEPNNCCSGENYGELFWNGLYWNDGGGGANGILYTTIVEFEPVPEPSSLVFALSFPSLTLFRRIKLK
jgi:hypothetical protein